MQAERILKELGALWQNLAQAELSAPAGSSVLRACAMTLIVAAEDAQDAQAASEVLAELMHEHPSRAIVLKPSDEKGVLDARVYAQCWMPFGRRQQICCEQIEITAASCRMGDVPQLMLGLLAPDLPVVLWCRGPRWFREPHFEQLLPLVHKLVVDSTRFPDPKAGFELVTEMRGKVRRVADLTWSRLTGWREVVAQAFDTPAELEAASRIREVRIGYAGARPTPSVYYFAAWMKRGLPSAEVLLDGVEGDGTGVRRVAFGDLELRAKDGCVVEVWSDGRTHTAMTPPCGDGEAMRQELSITRADTIFEEVLPRAAELAQ